MLATARRHPREHQPRTRLVQWALTVQQRRGHNKATIAVANKLGRIIWAVWTRETDFRATPAIADQAA